MDPLPEKNSAISMVQTIRAASGEDIICTGADLSCQKSLQCSAVFKWHGRQGTVARQHLKQAAHTIEPGRLIFWKDGAMAWRVCLVYSARSTGAVLSCLSSPQCSATFNLDNKGLLPTILLQDKATLIFHTVHRSS